MKPFIWAGAALAFLLAGCAPSMEMTIYAQDVAEVIETGKPLLISATVRIPQPSEDSCNEDLEQVVSAFGSMMPIDGSARCVSEEFNHFAELPTKLVLQVEGMSAAETLLTIEVVGVDETNETTVGLAIRMNSSVEEMTATLRSYSSQFSYIPSFDPPTFDIHFENDLRESVLLVPLHVFVDGEPHVPNNVVVDGSLSVNTNGYELARREGLNLRLSDVAAAHLAKKGAYVPMVLTLPSKPR